MIPVRNLKLILSQNNKTFSSDDFFQIHRHIEGYIKRVILIGLRLNGVQYATSVKIIEGTYMHTSAQIEKALILLTPQDSSRRETLSNFKEKYSKFFTLKDLFTKFTSPYRNRLAHGTVAELNDQKLIDYLCIVNLEFFIAFENLLSDEFGYSAFYTPSDWGAKRGTQRDFDVIVKKLKLGSIVPEPLKITAVQQVLLDIS